MSTLDLFADQTPVNTERRQLGENAWVLRGFALPRVTQLWSALDKIVAVAPMRHFLTARGFRMSVAMTNCGVLGWTSDRRGYRYTSEDPETGLSWPDIPAVFMALAVEAAEAAGFAGFKPDACLINRYPPGARLSLHQDKNERALAAPIVSVSLGLPATFLWGGDERAGSTEKVPLLHGDVVVWGGVDRLRYHGVAPIKEDVHPLTGACRINLTFRTAG